MWAGHELVCCYGYNGTSLKQITSRCGLPTGSVYHHFPGGKEQVGVAVVQHFGELYGRQVLAAMRAAGAQPGARIRAMFDGAALVVEAGGFVDPCPIGGVARESAGCNARLAAACDGVFQGWVDAAAAELQGDSDLATAIIAALEGGFILARVRQSGEPLRAIGRALAARQGGGLPVVA